jgi:hypothetical protein
MFLFYALCQLKLSLKVFGALDALSTRVLVDGRNH